MRRLFLLLLLLSLPPLLSAHEFWLHPNKFIYQWGERINVKLLVGENYEGELWSGDYSSIESLQLHLLDATDDLSSQIDTAKGDSLEFSIYDEGTYMVTYQSKNKFIELAPAKFHEYLKEDGLFNALEYRNSHNENDSNGREYYQRSVKTLFQVGTKTTNLYKKETKLPLDIIPLQNPYDLKRNTEGTLSFKVLFQKKPLPNQLIKIWNRNGATTTKIELTTDANGLINFPLQTTGRWMVSTVKMERVNEEGVDWQSYWGSVTWGYE